MKALIETLCVCHFGGSESAVIASRRQYELNVNGKASIVIAVSMSNHCTHQREVKIWNELCSDVSRQFRMLIVKTLLLSKKYKAVVLDCGLKKAHLEIHVASWTANKDITDSTSTGTNTFVPSVLYYYRSRHLCIHVSRTKWLTSFVNHQLTHRLIDDTAS